MKGAVKKFLQDVRDEEYVEDGVEGIDARALDIFGEGGRCLARLMVEAAASEDLFDEEDIDVAADRMVEIIRPFFN